MPVSNEEFEKRLARISEIPDDAEYLTALNALLRELKAYALEEHLKAQAGEGAELSGISIWTEAPGGFKHKADLIRIGENGLEINPDGIQDSALKHPELRQFLRKLLLARDYVKDSRQKPEYAHISTEALEIYRDYCVSQWIPAFGADYDPDDEASEEATGRMSGEIFARILSKRYGDNLPSQVCEQALWLISNDNTLLEEED
jgi:hypothetical protein